MTYRERQFRPTPPDYLVPLTTAVDADLITPTESRLIESFISEIDVLRKITDHRKYVIAHTLTSFRQYLPSYETCILSDVFVAIERYRAQTHHKPSTQGITLAIIKKFLIWAYNGGHAPLLDVSKIQEIKVSV